MRLRYAFKSESPNCPKRRVWRGTTYTRVESNVVIGHLGSNHSYPGSDNRPLSTCILFARIWILVHAPMQLRILAYNTLAA